MGSCQVLKNQKIREKLDEKEWPDATHPHIQFFFLKHVQQQKTTQKQMISKKKKLSELGLDPPTHEFFSDFFDFF